MDPEYTHILVVTVKLLGLNDGSAGNAYQSGMMINYDAQLNTNVSSIDSRIKKVFPYDDIFLCLVNLESIFDGLSVDQKTDTLEPIVESLFQNVNQVYFKWMIQRKEDVVNPTLAPTFEPSDGSSGGGNIGDRG
ncbi:hypothetical protein KFU94_24850 [Chloroflexi bacterium TSY]|nr:hypothetical protein [Chloroflexi bacterium TSY]